MIPRDIVFVTELPHNERAKVDVHALPAPPPRPEPAPLATPTEGRLERTWAEVCRTGQ
jgi:hypothetical protein